MVIGYHGNWHICVIPLMNGQLCLPNCVYMITRWYNKVTVVMYSVVNKDRLDGTLAWLLPSLPLGLVWYQYACNFGDLVMFVRD